jgi:hypothetical protein|tara:strand:- start:2026 stop:3372 length:1347 start_codon:yes stop_codon:yes gene_type:complete
MAGLKPIGSEKLEGIDKISRIMEIARYNEVKPTTINEDKKSVYSKTLADGHTYVISKEKVGYVIKRSLTESIDDAVYLDRMENRKHYSSYSKAFKRLNLIAREINVNESHDEETSLYEQSNKKYTLKTPTPAPVEEPISDMEDVAMDLGGEDTDLPMDLGDEDMGIEDEEISMEDEDISMEDEDIEDEESENDEEVSFKVIQKLTGKLGQKIRSFLDSGDQMSSKDVKYVINSILSAVDLSSLNDDDKEDILEKFEDYESEDEMDFEDDTESESEIDFEDDDVIGFDDSSEEFSEMKEDDGNYFGDAAEGDYSEIEDLKRDAEYDAKKHRESKKHRDSRRYRKEESVESKMTKKVGDMIETIFSESKVDSVLKKYFVVNEGEKKIENSKKVNTKNARKHSESISQEVASIKFLKENPKAKLIGKTNKGNLVFENRDRQYRISSKGMVI